MGRWGRDEEGMAVRPLYGNQEDLAIDCKLRGISEMNRDILGFRQQDTW